MERVPNGSERERSRPLNEEISKLIDLQTIDTEIDGFDQEIFDKEQVVADRQQSIVDKEEEIQTYDITELVVMALEGAEPKTEESAA